MFINLIKYILEDVCLLMNCQFWGLDALQPFILAEILIGSGICYNCKVMHGWYRGDGCELTTTLYEKMQECKNTWIGAV